MLEPEGLTGRERSRYQTGQQNARYPRGFRACLFTALLDGLQLGANSHRN
jgi:hypothetical protein